MSMRLMLKRRRLIVLLCASLALCGCASSDPPDVASDQSETTESEATTHASSNNTASVNSAGNSSYNSSYNSSDNSSTASTYNSSDSSSGDSSDDPASDTSTSTSASTGGGAREARRRAYEDWKRRWMETARRGVEAAQHGSIEDIYRYNRQLEQLNAEYLQNGYAEFNPGAGAPGMGSTGAGGGIGSSAGSTRMCMMCKGTGEIDTCAYSNRYDDSSKPCRERCTNCGGDGIVGN